MRHKSSKLVVKLAVLIGFGLLQGLLQTSLCVADDEDTRSKISVSGTAKVQVKPDQVVFTFSIDSREKKLADAVNDNDAKVKSVVEFLKASEVEAKNIRTQVISIRPIFDQVEPKWKGQTLAPVQQMSLPVPNLSPSNAPNAPAAAPAADDKEDKIKPLGYTARRQLAITIDKLDSFVKIYRGLIERGVNDVSGISFRTTELRKHRDAARLKAVQAAREKAEAMSGQLGAKLASVFSINERNNTGWRSPVQNSIFAYEGESGPGDSVASGLIEISATVDVVFILGDTGLDADAQEK